MTTRRLVEYYERELSHVEQAAAEFADAFPKIAGRLQLDAESGVTPDPFVQHLVQSFAYLAARVHLKIDDQHPTFTQHLLEMIYPAYGAPTPAMTIVRMEPDMQVGDLSAGFEVPRESTLSAVELVEGSRTRCKFRTAHPVTLWPIVLRDASYRGDVSDLPRSMVPGTRTPRAAIRLRFDLEAGDGFQTLPLRKLPLYLSGPAPVRTALYEALTAHVTGLALRIGDGAERFELIAGPECVAPLGFDESEALLPLDARGFDGYRLLYEYFAFPDRYYFVELAGLEAAARRTPGKTLELLLLLDRADAELQQSLSPANFSLYCTPAVNLFPKRTDRTQLTTRDHEHLLVADRTSSVDYEIYSVSAVTGYGQRMDEKRRFSPFYGHDDAGQRRAGAYFTCRRVERLRPPQRGDYKPEQHYAGYDFYVSLVDAHAAPHESALKEIGAQTLCTNRDLPIYMLRARRSGARAGRGTDKEPSTDLVPELSAPIASIRCLIGPTRPRPALAAGESSWRLISHLTPNYLSLVDADVGAGDGAAANGRGAVALRELLRLYAPLDDTAVQRQVDALVSVKAKHVVGRVPGAGPIAYGRGLALDIELDDTGFEGASSFLFGAVLDRFFAEYVSINTFTKTSVQTIGKGPIAEWPRRIGLREVI